MVTNNGRVSFLEPGRGKVVIMIRIRGHYERLCRRPIVFGQLLSLSVRNLEPLTPQFGLLLGVENCHA